MLSDKFRCSKGIRRQAVVSRPTQKWQEGIMKILDEECKETSRTIHWYWEPLGKTGKSHLCKYLCLHKGALILSGKSADMKHGVVKFQLDTGDWPSIILLDIPRSSRNFMAWSALEEIKNECFYSSKYEGGMCVMPVPHLVCFANSPPDDDIMSRDRWNTIFIEKKERVTVVLPSTKK